MKNIIYIVLLALGLVAKSCEKFDKLNTNPDDTTQAPASMMATSLILNVLEATSGVSFILDNMLSKQIAWPESLYNQQYNKFGKISFGGYTILSTGQEMVRVAREIDKNSYNALFYFIKAYKLFYISMDVGDIPYSDALKGEEGVQKPKYDTQKEVVIQVLEDLDKAYKLFDQGDNFDGDPIYNGNVEQWKKCVRAFQLKALMYLSKKESDNELNIKARFKQIVTEGSLFTSNKDNFQLVYSNKAGQLYPFCSSTIGGTSSNTHFAMISNMIIDNLKKYEDYRMFYYASPSEAMIGSVGGVTIDETMWEAYVSVNPANRYIDITDAYSNKMYCGLNQRYVGRVEGEPLIRLGYAEQNFILAEAVVRGWITGDAVTYYKEGIQASMQFIVEFTPNETIYNHGREMTPTYIADYYNSQPQVHLTGVEEEDIEKIILQRYLASFMQHPYDAYYDYRRTGYPELPINPNTNLNTVKDKIPVRWMYPKVEFDFNTVNANEAVQRQYDGSDEVNKLMWILK